MEEEPRRRRTRERLVAERLSELIAAPRASRCPRRLAAPLRFSPRRAGWRHRTDTVEGPALGPIGLLGLREATRERDLRVAQERRAVGGTSRRGARDSARR